MSHICYQREVFFWPSGDGILCSRLLPLLCCVGLQAGCQGHMQRGSRLWVPSPSHARPCLAIKSMLAQSTLAPTTSRYRRLLDALNLSDACMHGVAVLLAPRLRLRLRPTGRSCVLLLPPRPSHSGSCARFRCFHSTCPIDPAGMNDDVMRGPMPNDRLSTATATEHLFGMQRKHTYAYGFVHGPAGINS